MVSRYNQAIMVTPSSASRMTARSRRLSATPRASAAASCCNCALGCHGGNAKMPLMRKLVRISDPQRQGLGIGPADDLQRSWQAACGESVRHSHRAKIEEIDKACEHCRRRGLID